MPDDDRFIGTLDDLTLDEEVDEDDRWEEEEQ